MLSSIKPDYAHIPRRPQRSPQSPTVPGGTQHSTAEGRSGIDAHVRQERSCSDGRPKLATAPATGPHRSSQAFGRGSVVPPDRPPEPRQNQTPVHIHPFGYPDRARSKNRRIPPFLSMTLIRGILRLRKGTHPHPGTREPTSRLRPAGGQLDPQIRVIRVSHLFRPAQGPAQRPRQDRSNSDSSSSPDSTKAQTGHRTVWAFGAPSHSRGARARSARERVLAGHTLAQGRDLGPAHPSRSTSAMEAAASPARATVSCATR